MAQDGGIEPMQPVFFLLYELFLLVFPKAVVLGNPIRNNRTLHQLLFFVLVTFAITVNCITTIAPDSIGEHTLE